MFKAAQDHAINLTRPAVKGGEGKNLEIYTVAYTVSQS